MDTDTEMQTHMHVHYRFLYVDYALKWLAIELYKRQLTSVATFAIQRATRAITADEQDNNTDYNSTSDAK